MKRKYTDRQLASMNEKMIAARKLINQIERQLDNEIAKVSDRLIDLECMENLNAKQQQEYKDLDKYENKLCDIT